MYMPICGTKIVLIDWEMHERQAPENEGLVLLQHKASTLVVMCEVNTDEWKIWIITPRQLRVYATLFVFHIFAHPYFINAMEAHIGQHISQSTEMQTLCWRKTSPSFSSARNSYISWSINTIWFCDNNTRYINQRFLQIPTQTSNVSPAEITKMMFDPTNFARCIT